jgi:hypothetical protein
MTVADMVYEFQRLLETINPGFKVEEKVDTNEIVRFLNWGCIRYLKEKYLTAPTERTNVEILRNNMADLLNLLTDRTYDGTDLVPDATYLGIKNVLIPDNYFYIVRGDAYIERGSTVFEWMPSEIINYSELEGLIPTSINKPLVRKPVIFFSSQNTISLFMDSNTDITKFKLTYIRKPKELVMLSPTETVEDPNTQTGECELAEYLHEEIVKFSVDMYILEYKYKLSGKQAS